jgi:hypothetical protein
MASLVDVHRAGIVRGLIASVAAAALVLVPPDGSASGSGPSPQPVQFASGLGAGGVVPDERARTSRRRWRLVWTSSRRPPS